jgi:hypothetical protein
MGPQVGNGWRLQAALPDRAEETLESGFPSGNPGDMAGPVRHRLNNGEISPFLCGVDRRLGERGPRPQRLPERLQRHPGTVRVLVVPFLHQPDRILHTGQNAVMGDHVIACDRSGASRQGMRLLWWHPGQNRNVRQRRAVATPREQGDQTRVGVIGIQTFRPCAKVTGGKRV